MGRGKVDAFLEHAEERGLVAEPELEALAFEHGLDEDELAGLRAELAVREVEIVDASVDGREPARAADAEQR